MAILKVARLGHPVLRQIAEPVSPEAIAAPEIQRLIDDMLETMDEYDGAGLAAPQVHVSRRIVIYGVHQNPRYPDAEDVPLTVLVNPKITPATSQIEEDWEGCLSVPEMRGRVPRHTKVEVKLTAATGSCCASRPTASTRASCSMRRSPDGTVYLDRMRSSRACRSCPSSEVRAPRRRRRRD
jgi:peptide deformylase